MLVLHQSNSVSSVQRSLCFSITATYIKYIRLCSRLLRICVILLTAMDVWSTALRVGIKTLYIIIIVQMLEKTMLNRPSSNRNEQEWTCDIQHRRIQKSVESESILFCMLQLKHAFQATFKSIFSVGIGKHPSAARCRWRSVKKLLPDNEEPRTNWSKCDWNDWHIRNTPRVPLATIFPQVGASYCGKASPNLLK